MKVAKQAPVSTANEKPLWSLAKVDPVGPFDHGVVLSATHLAELLHKLAHMESMTWAQIESDRKRNHSVPVQDMVREAKNRLEYIKQDDIDEMFRFRFTGKQRLWGIRTGNVFEVIWWDPEHEVCPSIKKHT